MNYLDNYLKIIPEYDANEIRKALKENEKHFGLENISQYEFENLVKQLSVLDAKVTEVPLFQEKIESDTLNTFYSSTAIDLKRLFAKQESIEVANENYYHIYQSTLDEISRAVNVFRRHIEQLKYRKDKEKGLVIKEYSFEKENELRYTESYTEDTAYLFIDRDGSQLDPAETNRFYHNYSLTLQKEEEVNVLLDKTRLSTAKIEILYQTPGTLTNTNALYGPDRMSDGSSDTFWFNVCLKSNNDLDKVNNSPKGWG